VSKRTQENTNGGERQRDRGNNVNVRYIRRQTDQRFGRYNSDYRINQNGRGDWKKTIKVGLIPQRHVSTPERGNTGWKKYW
jgi:hypothetical protein